MEIEKAGRFGHHPDPAVDFCVEVEEIEAMVYNRSVGFDPEPSLDGRMTAAAGFKDVTDLWTIDAKACLRDLAMGIEVLPAPKGIG